MENLGSDMWKNPGFRGDWPATTPADVIKLNAKQAKGLKVEPGYFRLERTPDGYMDQYVGPIDLDAEADAPAAA